LGFKKNDEAYECGDVKRAKKRSGGGVRVRAQTGLSRRMAAKRVECEV